MGREGAIAILEKTKRGITSARFFEVVIVRRHNGFTIAGNVIPPGESMPSSEHWGTHGWSFSDAERAWAKFRKLRDQQQPSLFAA
jgi:hypothetical protein